jgi:predicted membrane protein
LENASQEDEPEKAFFTFYFLLFTFLFVAFSLCYFLFSFCFMFSIFIFIYFYFTFIFCFLVLKSMNLEEFTLNRFNLISHMESLVPETLDGLLKKGVQGLTFLNGSCLDAPKCLDDLLLLLFPQALL